MCFKNIQYWTKCNNIALIPGVGLGDGVGVGLQVSQIVTPFVSIVTAPVDASARPLRFAPVVSVILAVAKMFPRKLLPVPSVAELPTTQ